MFRSVPRSAGWICLEAMLPPSQPPAIQRVTEAGIIGRWHCTDADQTWPGSLVSLDR